MNLILLNEFRSLSELKGSGYELLRSTEFHTTSSLVRWGFIFWDRHSFVVFVLRARVKGEREEGTSFSVLDPS